MHASILSDREKAQYFQRTMSLQSDCGSETLREIIKRKLSDKGQPLKQYLQRQTNVCLKYRKLSSMDISSLTQILLFTPIGITGYQMNYVDSLRSYRNRLAHRKKANLEDDSLYQSSKTMILNLAKTVSIDWHRKIQEAIIDLEKRELLSYRSNLELIELNKETFMVQLVEASGTEDKPEPFNEIRIKCQLTKWTKHLSRGLDVEVFLKSLKDKGVIPDNVKKEIELEYNYEEQIHKLVLHIIREESTENLLRFCTVLRKCNHDLADLVEEKNTEGRDIEHMLERMEQEKIVNILKEYFRKDEAESVPCEDVHIFVEEKLGLMIDFSVIEKCLGEVFVMEKLKENDSTISCLTWKESSPYKKEVYPEASDNHGELSDYIQFANYLGQEFEKERPTSTLGSDIREGVIKESLTATIFAEMTEGELKDVFSKYLPNGVSYGFGISKTLLCVQRNLKARLKPVANAVGTGSLRRFDTPTRSQTYKICTIRPETGNYLIPGHAFVDVKKNNSCDVKFIVKEVLRYAASFLNGRKNGTVHFGITNCGGAALIGGIDTSCFHDTTPALLDFEIRKGIELCFKPEQISIAKLCVRPCQFVPVENGAVVIEIDIVPFTGHLKEQFFEIQFPPKGKQRKLCVVYNDELQPIEMCTLMESNATTTAARRQVEHEYLKIENTPPILGKRLGDLLKKGNDYVTDAFCPIICSGRISDSINEDEIRKTLEMDKAFTSSIAIFDFDSSSSLQQKTEKDVRHFRIKLPEDFTDSSSKEQDVSNYRCSWVYCNGNTNLDIDTMDFETWTDKRLGHVKKALGQFREMIPKGRALVIFLVYGTTIDRDPMFEIARESFISLFKGECVFISDEEDNLEYYKKELSNLLGYKNVEKYFHANLKWSEISEVMKSVFRADLNVVCKLPCSLGNCVEMTIVEKEEEHFVDIGIVSGEQCEYEDQKMGTDESRKKRTDEAERFYKGNEVSWWNFYYGNHVGERDSFIKYRKEIDEALSRRDGNILVEVHEIGHYPAAGGTTLGMHILWHFSQFRNQGIEKAYRCCVVNKISESTVNELVRFRKFKDTNPKPIILLVDNKFKENVYSLQNQLEEQAYQTDLRGQLFCVILLVTSVSMSTGKPPTNRIRILNHHLSIKEQHWFEAKFEELEKKTDIDVKTLIAFNVMRHSFDQLFVRNTAHRILQNVEKKEMDLLKCLSLINTFESGQTVPECIFDNLMEEKRNVSPSIPNYSYGILQSLRKRVKQGNYYRETWNVSMTESLAVLITKRTNKNEKLPSSDGGVCIISQLLAKEIHEYIKYKYQLTLSDIVKFVLQQVQFHSNETNPAAKQFKAIVSSLFKTRPYIDTGKGETKAAFSELVLKLHQPAIDEEEKSANERVVSLMEQCFDATQDAMVGQQLARFNYIHVKDYEAAKSVIQRSLHQHPKNSYLLDTYGQIYRSNMEFLINSVERVDGKISDNDVIDIVKLAFQALEKFIEGQRAALVFEDGSNLFCCQMEVHTALLLLESFAKFKCHQNNLQFCRFLNDPSFPVDTSSFKDICEATSLSELRNGNKNYCHLNWSLRRVEERAYQVKFNMYTVHAESNKLPLTMRERFEKMFGTTAGTSKYIFHYGHSLKHLLIACDQHPDLLEKRIKEAEHNIKTRGLPKANDKDLLILLGHTIIRLSSEADTIKLNETEYDVLLKQSTRLIETQSNAKRHYLEAYLYHALLHWPCQSKYHFPSLCDPKTYQTCLDMWETEYKKNHSIENADQMKRNRPKTVFALGNGLLGNYFINMERKHKQWREEKADDERMIRKPAYGDTIWQTPGVDQNVMQLEGIVSGDGRTVLYKVEYKQNKHTFAIKTYYPNDTLTNRKITFVLGFTWIGIRAFCVKEKLTTVCQQNAEPLADENIGNASREVNTDICVIQQSHQNIDHVDSTGLDDPVTVDDALLANASSDSCHVSASANFELPSSSNNRTEPIRPTNFPLKEKFDFRFACLICLQKLEGNAIDGWIVSNQQHECLKNSLIVREKAVRDGKWLMLRPRPFMSIKNIKRNSFNICKYITNGRACQLDTACKSPHHDAEKQLWKRDWDGNFDLNGFMESWRVHIICKRNQKVARKAEEAAEKNKQSYRAMKLGNKALWQDACSSQSNQAINDTNKLRQVKETAQQTAISKVSVDNDDLLKNKADDVADDMESMSEPVNNWLTDDAYDDLDVDSLPDKDDHTVVKEIPEDNIDAREQQMSNNSLSEHIVHSPETADKSFNTSSAKLNSSDTEIQTHNIDPQMAFPLKDDFDFRIVCNTCVKKIGEGVKGYKTHLTLEHYCSRNMLITKDKHSSNSNWLRVRVCPESIATKQKTLKKCGHFVKGKICKHGEDKCEFYHHPAEKKLWEKEQRDEFCIQRFILMERPVNNSNRDDTIGLNNDADKAECVETNEKGDTPTPTDAAKNKMSPQRDLEDVKTEDIHVVPVEIGNKGNTSSEEADIETVPTNWWDRE